MQEKKLKICAEVTVVDATVLIASKRQCFCDDGWLGSISCYLQQTPSFHFRFSEKTAEF